MIVSYNFNCSWNSPKKEQVSNLLSERVLLLVGNIVFEKIHGISFCEKECFEGKFSEGNCLISNHRFVVLNINESPYKKTYEVVLEKDILFSMLTPGAGQSRFDELIIELKNTVQNN